MQTNHLEYNTRIVKLKSTPQLRVSNSCDHINKRLRRCRSGLQHLIDSLNSSRRTRMIYDYYQYKKDDEFSSDVDRYGFIQEELTNQEKRRLCHCPRLSNTQEKINTKKDVKRTLKWDHWVSDSKFAKFGGIFTSYIFPVDSKFLERISKGIPDSWRSSVWYFLATNNGGIGIEFEFEFDEKLIGIYNELLKLPSTHERQIDLDIPRTLNSHIMFRTRYGPGQRALFNVLRAFSNYDRQVGYCQGMANIVSILLMYYSEENAFVMLTKLFTRCNLHDLYIPGFPALMESFYVQEKLMDIYAHKISDHFKVLQIPSTAYATRWYITLFSNDVVPHHTVLRIWDLLMLHGFDILYFTAVALLKYYESILLSSDFDQALTMLSSSINIANDDKLTRKIVEMYNKQGKNLIDIFKAEYKQSLITLT